MREIAIGAFWMLVWVICSSLTMIVIASTLRTLMRKKDR